LTPSASDGTDDKVYAVAPGASWVENSGPRTNTTPYQSPTYSTDDSASYTCSQW